MQHDDHALVPRRPGQLRRQGRDDERRGPHPALNGRAAPAAFVAGAVLLLGSADGGYDEAAWRLAAAGLLACALLGVVLGGRRPSGAFAVTLGALVLLDLWTVLSAAWAEPGAHPWREAERTLVYVAALAAVRPVRATAVADGMLAGLGSLFVLALGAYLLGPRAVDRYEGALLFRPVGYANAAGLLATMGILLALPRLASAHRARAATGAVALVVLAPALVLSESRGAALALAAGGAVLAWLRRGPLPTRALAAAVPAVVAAALAGVSRLTDAGLPADRAAVEGRLLAAALLVLATAAVAVVRWSPRRSLRVPRVIGAAAIVAAVCALTAGLALRDPLGDRTDYWRVALSAARDHPALGIGAGGFAAAWGREGEPNVTVHDAHSLYVETLAELGPFGLALLLTALVTPLAAGRLRARAALTAVYAAYLVHAGLDWDWELPVTTVTALFAAGGVLAAED